MLAQEGRRERAGGARCAAAMAADVAPAGDRGTAAKGHGKGSGKAPRNRGAPPPVWRKKERPEDDPPPEPGAPQTGGSEPRAHKQEPAARGRKGKGKGKQRPATAPDAEEPRPGKGKHFSRAGSMWTYVDRQRSS